MTRGTLAATGLTALLLVGCAGGGELSDVTTPSTNGPPPTSATAAAAPATGEVASSASGPGTDLAAATTSAGPPSTAVLSWNADVDPLSGPLLVDGVLVLYTRDGDGMAITGVEPSTGEVLWSHPATPSRALPGVGVYVAAAGEDRVVHLEPLEEGPDGPADSRVVVREAATGRAIVRTGEMSHYRLPRACTDPEGEICVYQRSGQAQHPVQVLHDDGSLGPVDLGEASAYIGPLGPLGLRRATGQEIGSVKDGDLVWSTRTDEVFGSGASTNTGWTFQSAEEDRLIIGSVGPVDDSRPQDVDLQVYSVAALDARTGERRWLSEGTSLFCDVDLGLEDNDPLLACRYTAGTLEIGSDGQAHYSDVEVSLVRLDPRTGETRWELELETPSDEGRPAVAPLDEEHVIVAGLTVDVADGSARPSTGSETAWEEDDREVALSLPRLGSVEIYPSSTWLLPSGASLEGTGPRWPLPPGVGVEAGPGRVVTVDRQLVRWDAP